MLKLNKWRNYAIILQIGKSFHVSAEALDISKDDDDAQTLSTGVNNLQLHMPAKKIETLHAADIADIIEDLDSKSRDILFHSLNNQKAAEVLEEIETDIQVNLIKSMSDEKVNYLYCKSEL